MLSSSSDSRPEIPHHLREFHGPVRRHDRLHPLLARLGRHERHDAVDQRFRLHRPTSRRDRPGEGEEPVGGLAEPVDLLDVQLEHPPLGHAFRDGVRRISAVPFRAWSGFLISWAIPAVISPSAPSFPARISCASIRRCSARASPSRSPTVPAAPARGAPGRPAGPPRPPHIIEDDLQALLQGVRGVLHQEARERVREVTRGEHGNGDPAPHAAGKRGEEGSAGSRAGGGRRVPTRGAPPCGSAER